MRPADTLFRIAAAPLLIAQALAVRRRAQSLPEADGARQGVAGTGPELKLRIIGDSSAAGVGVADQQDALSGQLVAQLASRFTLHWSLDALTGATTRSTLQRLQDRVPEHTDIVVIALGVNDITRLIPVRRWLSLQGQLIHRVRSLYAPRQIYLSGIPPMGQFPLLPQPLRWTLGRHAAAFDHAIRQWAEGDPHLRYLPFDMPLTPEVMAPDGFHPGPAGYALWAEKLAAAIFGDLEGGSTFPR